MAKPGEITIFFQLFPGDLQKLIGEERKDGFVIKMLEVRLGGWDIHFAACHSRPV